jgi:DNA-binding IclR family transcriptional regulator
MTTRPDPCARILAYLAESHKVNETAETSIIELERELDLERDAVRRCLEDLVARGLATGDLFPLIAWVRISVEGAAAIESSPNGSSSD